MKLEVMDNGLSEYELVDESGETVAYMASAGDFEAARNIVKAVNNHERLVEALEECRDAMESFNRAPGATRDEWEFECEVKEIDTLLATLEAEKGG